MITRETYFDRVNAQKYMGSSQYKDFILCPAMAMAKINGEYKEEQTDAFLQGDYMDAHFEGTLDLFKAKHPELYQRNGNLYAKFQSIEDNISIIESDSKMNELCSGEQQVIMTGEIVGVPFKIMIDSLLPDRIVDRKCMKDFQDKWVDGEYVPWWKAYRYDIQAAIYQEIYYQNTGKRLPFELVAISKEKTPSKAWVHFTDDTLQSAIQEVRYHAPIFQAIKDGLIEPTACGECDWCKMNQTIDDVYEEV